jgi:hypothetical protein
VINMCTGHKQGQHGARNLAAVKCGTRIMVDIHTNNATRVASCQV